MKRREARWIAAACLLAVLAAAPAALAQPEPAEDPATRPVRKAAQTGIEQESLSRDAAGDGSGWARTLLALGLVVALVFVVRHVLRRFGPGAPAGNRRAVQVVSRVSVSPRQQLVLVRLGERLLLIGSGADGMRTLAEVTDPDEVAALTGAAAKTPEDNDAK